MHHLMVMVLANPMLVMMLLVNVILVLMVLVNAMLVIHSPEPSPLANILTRTFITRIALTRTIITSNALTGTIIYRNALTRTIIYRAIISIILCHVTLILDWIRRSLDLRARRPMHHLIAPIEVVQSVIDQFWLTFTNNGHTAMH